MSTGPNLVDIVGEQVDLTDQSDKSMAPTIVNFSDQYVPGDMTDQDKEKLKGVLKRVFKNKNQPPPPCNGADKELILKSLEGRLEKLRGQRNTASKVKDTAGARTTIEHIKRLCSFIDRFRKADCDDQNLVYSESSLGELTDSTVDTLLKQFIFVLLQSHLPIEDYKQWTEKSKDIVRKIGTMPSDLDEIIQKFEGKIPNRIKELINCMKMVPLNTIEKMVQDEIQMQLNKSIDKLKKVIDAKDPFWKVLGSQPTIEGVIDALLEKMKELCSKTGPGSGTGSGSGPGQNTEIEVLTAEIERLKKLLDTLQSNNTEILSQISQIEDEISKLKASMNKGTGTGTGTGTDPTLLAQLQAKNLELEQLLEELLNNNNDYKAKLLFTLSPEQLAKLQANFDLLQGEFDKLLQLNKKHDEKEKGLLLKLTQLEKDTSKSSDPILINANKLLKEALEKIKANNEDLQRFINILEQQLMVMQNKHAEKIREVEGQIKILEEQRSKSSDTILEKLREKDNELEAEIVKLEEQLRALKLKHEAEVEPLKAEILTLKAQNEAYKAQLAELQKLNRQLETEISRLTVIVKEKEAEIAGLLAAKKALQDNNTVLVTKLTELSSEVAALKQSISDLVNHYTQTKDDLEAKLAGKDAELKSLTSGATSSQKSQAELQGKIAEVSKEIETLKNRIFELTEKYTKEKTQLETQLVERNTEINALKMDSAASKLEIERLSSEIKSLKQRIDELTVQYDATKNALDESIKEFELIGPLLDEILEDLEKIKTEKDTEIEGLKKELEKCSGIAAELDTLKTEKAGLQEQLKDLTGTVSGLIPSRDKAELFNYLIEKTGDLESKLASEGLTNATIDSFIAALKAKEDDLRKCGEDGVKAKAAIDTLTKELEDKKAETNTLLTEAKDAADKAAAAALALKAAEDKLKNAESETAKKQAETDLKIAEANKAMSDAQARAADAEANAAAAADAVLQAQQAAKALVLQESSSQAQKDAAAKAEKQEALARAEQAEAAQKVKEAEAAVALAAQQAEQSLREAAEKQSGENKEALEKAALRIQAAENEKTGLEGQLETLKKQLEECKNAINRDALKAIILAFSNSSKSEIEFTLENDDDKDLNDLREVIREQIKNRNDWQNAYTSMEGEKNDWQNAYTSMDEFIKIIADNINNPEWKGDDIPEGSLKDLVNIILPLRNKESKVKDLQEFCSLLFFTSHILSTHFTVAEQNPIKKGYNQLMANLNETKKYTDLSVVINILMPILNLMEQLYQSGQDGSFYIKPDEFFNDPLGKNLFDFLKGQLKGDLTTEAINRHFANKTGRSEDGPLSKVYIIIDNKNNMMEVIQNQSGLAKEVSNAEIQKPLSYSSIAQRFDAALTTRRLTKDDVSKDMTLSYPVLFYFLIFTFKNYLNTRQGKLQGTQCRLPRIFQQGQ